MESTHDQENELKLQIRSCISGIVTALKNLQKDKGLESYRTAVTKEIDEFIKKNTPATGNETEELILSKSSTPSDLRKMLEEIIKLTTALKIDNKNINNIIKHCEMGYKLANELALFIKDNQELFVAEVKKKDNKQKIDSSTNDFNFGTQPQEIKELIFKFFHPDTHKIGDINRVSKEWNKLSKSDFMVIKYCKRNPVSGWTDMLEGYVETGMNWQEALKQNMIKNDSCVEQIIYEFKNPGANVQRIVCNAFADGSYTILFQNPTNFESMRKILEQDAHCQQSVLDLDSKDLSTNNYNSDLSYTRNSSAALEALKKEEALKQHGIPKLILDLISNEIEKRDLLISKPVVKSQK